MAGGRGPRRAGSRSARPARDAGSACRAASNARDRAGPRRACGRCASREVRPPRDARHPSGPPRAGGGAARARFGRAVRRARRRGRPPRRSGRVPAGSASVTRRARPPVRRFPGDQGVGIADPPSRRGGGRGGDLAEQGRDPRPGLGDRSGDRRPAPSAAGDADVGPARAERRDAGRVEMATAVGADARQRLLEGHRRLVGPRRGQGVEHVRHRDDPGRQGDRGAGEPVRVAAAVPSLVMRTRRSPRRGRSARRRCRPGCAGRWSRAS